MRCFEGEFAGRLRAVLEPGPAGSPLIVLHTDPDGGGGVSESLRAINAPACSLLQIEGVEWERDLSPWACPPVMKNAPPCTGGADEYIPVLTGRILPWALNALKTAPAFTGIAGYSLAGLFALYALYACDRFDAAASVSGSLWFPGLIDYVKTHSFQRTPKRLYVSLGDREANTRHPLLSAVLESTLSLVALYREQGIDVTFELNPGNHFRDPALRTAKGIAALTRG